MISVYIVDAKEIFRRGIRDAINETSDLHVVGEAATAAVARRELETLDSDVIVVEFDGSAPDVIDFCRLITSGPTRAAVLMSLSAPDRNRIDEAALAGASGHILTTQRAEVVTAAIRDAHRTPPRLTSEIVGDLFDRVRSGQPSHRDPLAKLTGREREVMALLADGLDNRRIGEILHLSPKTVKNYASAILKKLRMSSRTEAAVFAAREAVRTEA